MWWILPLACVRREPVVPDDTASLALAARVARTSLALRGVRPSLAELDAVASDPDTLPELVDGWLDAPGFGETVRELHDEAWGIRSDYSPVPASGTLAGVEMGRLKQSLFEAPLRLAEQIVVEDRPYTEIVTADRAWADEIVAAAWEGLDGYPDGATGWREVRWTDGRPAAGILSDSWLWVIYRSAGANWSRGRAAVTLRATVCEDLFTEDVPITSGIDLSDPAAVADAVRTDPSCTGCHATLDPVAASFPFRDYFVLQRSEFPIRMVAVDWEHRWETTIGVAPGWRGEAVGDLAGLGRAIARDPMFARCTARRFAAFLTRREPRDVPEDEIDGLVPILVERWSVRDLVTAIVATPPFTLPPSAPDGDLHEVGPEQLSRMLADLTGFVWEEDVRTPCCGAELGENPLGPVDLLRDGHHGHRVLAGGIDNPFQGSPVHTANPTYALVLRSVAPRAAAYAVDVAARGDPGLLDPAWIRGGPDPALRTELARVCRRVTSRTTDPEGAEVDDLLALFRELERGSGPLRAWTVVLAALLQSPGAVLY